MSTAKKYHPKEAADFVANDERAHWHDKALWFVRTKRDKAAGSLPEWETLRETASQIKAHMVSKHADYLEQFEEQATKMGAVVHWAKTTEEHRILQNGSHASWTLYSLLRRPGLSARRDGNSRSARTTRY